MSVTRITIADTHNVQKPYLEFNPDTKTALYTSGAGAFCGVHALGMAIYLNFNKFTSAQQSHYLNRLNQYYELDNALTIDNFKSILSQYSPNDIQYILSLPLQNTINSAPHLKFGKAENNNLLSYIYKFRNSRDIWFDKLSSVAAANDLAGFTKDNCIELINDLVESDDNYMLLRQLKAYLENEIGETSTNGYTRNWQDSVNNYKKYIKLRLEKVEGFDEEFADIQSKIGNLARDSVVKLGGGQYALIIGDQQSDAAISRFVKAVSESNGNSYKVTETNGRDRDGVHGRNFFDQSQLNVALKDALGLDNDAIKDMIVYYARRGGDLVSTLEYHSDEEPKLEICNRGGGHYETTINKHSDEFKEHEILKRNERVFEVRNINAIKQSFKKQVLEGGPEISSYSTKLSELHGKIAAQVNKAQSSNKMNFKRFLEGILSRVKECRKDIASNISDAKSLLKHSNEVFSFLVTLNSLETRLGQKISELRKSGKTDKINELERYLEEVKNMNKDPNITEEAISRLKAISRTIQKHPDLQQDRVIQTLLSKLMSFMKSLLLFLVKPFTFVYEAFSGREEEKSYSP